MPGRRGAMEHVQLLHHLGDFRHDLHRACTGTDDAHALAGEVYMIIPPRRMERFALKRFHAFDPGQFRCRKGTVCQHHVTRAHLVTTVRGDDPARRSLVPLGADPGSGLEEFGHLQSGEPPAREAESGAFPAPGRADRTGRCAGETGEER